MKKATVLQAVCVGACVMSFFAVLLTGCAGKKAAYTLTFNLNGGEGKTPGAIIVKEGEKAVLPDFVPVRSGYTFAGWYTTKTAGQYEALPIFTPRSGPATLEIGEDTVAYAQWLANDHVKTVTTTTAGKTVTLGYSASSGVKVRKFSDNSEVPAADLAGGQLSYGAYKDLNRNGKLDAYEDWRLSVDERTKDLAAKMSYKEIAGLMLYSAHQRDWSKATPTQAQAAFLANDDLRHVLIAGEIPAHIAAPWNNSVQAICERLGLGIPANNSSDPRHSAAIGVEFYSSNSGTISLWPNSLGLAATFDPEVVFDFAKTASAEYRALGIATALSPQIDIATDPRWYRTNGTFGEDPQLSRDMAQAYVRGFQGTFSADGSLTGWGTESVNAMIKHWPGGGGGESGRDAHNEFGKYSVFPGNNFDAHAISFVDAGLNGTAEDTTMATAVMPYYTISFNIDPAGKDLANAFSDYMLTDLLRGRYKFDGVICTDWGVDSTRGWGPAIETLSPSQRAKVLIEAGVDQFGGQNTSRYILEAVELAKNEGTEAQFRVKMEESAVRLLKNIFRTGLFENSYLDAEVSKATVANNDFVTKGYEAQLKSVVMVKNSDVLPLKQGVNVYIPKDAQDDYVFKNLQNYFTVVDDAAKADVALVAFGSPANPLAPDNMFGGGWKPETGYFPLTLQYAEYTAVDAREVSIGGDYRNLAVDGKNAVSTVLNRTYKNKKTTATNAASFALLAATKEQMGSKPVIAVINMDNPFVMTEVDALADAVLFRFAASDNAVTDIVRGAAEPSGLLPMQMPASMSVVEKQFEDLPRDMVCYVDGNNNTYDFAFGLNWNGVINDDRVAKYKVPPLTAPKSGSIVNDYVTVTTVTLPLAKNGSEYNAAISAKEPGATFELLEGELFGLFFDNGVISGRVNASGDRVSQLLIQASAPGKKSRVFRITLAASDAGSVNLADPNGLSIVLNLAGAKKRGNYTSESWQAFSAAHEVAKTKYAGAAKASQQELDAAAQSLSEAMYNLQRNK